MRKSLKKQKKESRCRNCEGKKKQGRKEGRRENQMKELMKAGKEEITGNSQKTKN